MSVSALHIDEHSARHSDTKVLQCPECPKMFATKYALNAHVKIHAKFFCGLCGKHVRQLSERDHNLTYHTPEDQKPFQCSICTPVKGFIQKQHLDEHMNIHNGVKPFKCTMCPDVAYASKGNLAAHVRAFHKGIKRKSKK